MEKKWIIMLYLAADNNLSEEGVWTLTEIQDAVQQGKLRNDLGLVVLFDTNIKGRKTQIFEFGLGTEQNHSDLDKTRFGKRLAAGIDVRTWLENQDAKLNLEDANSPDLLTAFIKKTAEKYHAAHHALILSGHGSGAVGDFLGQGEDNVTGSDYKGMSIPTLGQALENAGVTIDLLGMDSCLMSMAEVCFELPAEARLLVGSEGNGPLTGWPFQEILAKLHDWKPAQPTADPPTLKATEMARIIQDEYIHYYSDYFVAGTSVDMAVCDLDEDKKKKLKQELKVLAEALGEEIQNNSTVRDQVILAHWRAQSYKNDQYTDLWDFCDLLQEGMANHKIIGYCDNVKETIKSIVLKCRYYGVGFQHSNGLSVYFPWKYTKELDAYTGGDETAFTGLRFAHESKWGDFLKDYVYVTRREMRGLTREKGQRILEHEQPEKIEIVTSTGTTTPVQLLEDRNFPPDSRNFPPDSRNFPPDSRNFPPDSRNFPPDSRNFPPDSRGLLARLTTMKNPPIGFLRDKDTGEEIYLVEEES